MISENQKTKLQKHLKGSWVNDVLTDLDARDITTRNGEAYSASMVRAVFNGTKENDEIETSILNVFSDYKKAAQALERRKRKLLSA